MRLTDWFRSALVAGFIVSLTACGFIGNLFPDKQKQYRYSGEIPDLEIPPDLSASKIEGREDESALRPEPGRYTREETAEAEETPSRPKTRKTPAKHGGSTAILAESSDNAALIEVDQPFPETWNDVSRALGRLKVEITDQDRSDGVFYVYYGGEPPKKAEETSFWDDVASIFGSEKDPAREYRVKLKDKESHTYILVLDQEDNPVSEGPGLELLKNIHRKLLTLDQPESESGETENKTVN